MVTPWDIPPTPTKGDDDQEITYAAVGRVLSQWEMIEVRLGYIYAWLMKRPDEIETVRAYSEGKRNFEERITGLLQIAEVYFRWNPHQDTEGELEALVSMVRKFAIRRNDVAHCIVQPFQWIEPPGHDGPLQFCALPALYNGKKFDPLPTFIYTSVELNSLSDALFGVGQDAQRFQWRLMLGEDGLPP